MQRKWRLGRLVLAGLFLALAGWAYAYWPATMRWRVERHDRNVIGFCPARNVVWTVNGILDSARPDASDHLSGLDIASGSRVLGHRLPYGSFLASDNTLSTDGQYLAVLQTALKKINIIHAISGESILQIDPAPNYFDATFSDDGHWFVIVHKTTLEVWDLRQRYRQHEYDLKQFEKGEVRTKNSTQARNDFMPSGTRVNISKDNRYLSFWKEHVLSVFEMGTMKLIGEAECQGRPQFLADGRIAAYQAESYVVNPWNSTFVIDEHGLKCVGQNTEMDKVQIADHNERHLAQNQTSYVTIQRPSNRLRCPEWIHTSVQPLVNQLLAKLNKDWRITLRDLDTGKEISHFGVQHVEKPIIAEDSFTLVSGSFVSGYRFDEYVPFGVFISPDHCWLVKQDRNYIELWPLLTWWRPWYCWATVAGLVAMAGPDWLLVGFDAPVRRGEGRVLFAVDPDLTGRGVALGVLR
ncbi:MAG TPA: hypothetical protein PLN21_17570, partial [Gemmatales bacterium]|nr:hypothetical protein [Gemmatales bacterium]